jgi:secreted trypsin-like serine protease
MDGAEKKLIGVVSMGKGCETGKHTLFTRVTSYLEWIKDNTADFPITISP